MPITVSVNQITTPPNTSDNTPGTLVLRDANGAAALDLKPGTVIDGSSTTPALRVTQTGSGDALLIEDSANPDSTPLVVNNLGQIISGATTPFSDTAGLQITADSADSPNASLVIQRCQNANGNASIIIQRAAGTNASKVGLTAAGTSIGSLIFSGYDGTDNRQVARITCMTDGACGPDDMPGRIQFLTTSDGASAVTERMRIDSAGNVGIGGTADADAILDLQSTTKGFLPPRMTTTQRNAIASPIPAGLMVYNTTTNKLNFYNGTAWEAVTSS